MVYIKPCSHPSLISVYIIQRGSPGVHYGWCFPSLICYFAHNDTQFVSRKSYGYRVFHMRLNSFVELESTWNKLHIFNVQLDKF